MIGEKLSLLLNLNFNMISFREYLKEGGWSSVATQNTIITPMMVDHAVKILHDFVAKLNVHLKLNNVPPVELGDTCGSTTYYKRDMVTNPTREYGDIDVNLFITRIEGMSNNANANLYKSRIKEFCQHNDDFQTDNGTNVIIKIGADYIQIDFITAYHHNREWTKALAPEYNVKGVLCNSLYSSFGEALHLSFGGGHGLQVKMQDDKIVPFRTVKDATLHTISNNPKTWAIDIAKFFGCTKMSPKLKAYPGMKDEVRVTDIVNSFKGIAETLESNGKLPHGYPDATHLIHAVKAIYLGKINTVIMSSKFDKAISPAAVEKAEKTKEQLTTKGAYFASLLTN